VSRTQVHAAEKTKVKNIHKYALTDLHTGTEFRKKRNVILFSENQLLKQMYVLTYLGITIFFYLAQQPPVGQGLLIHKVNRSHTSAHYNR